MKSPTGTIHEWQPPPPPPLHDRSAHVWRVRLDAPADDLLELLSPDERERASRFYRPEDRRAYIVAHAHLRLILARYAAAPPESLEFTADALGKPSLASAASGPRLEFNLSHSGAFALIAVARGRRVGVDVEQWRTTFDHVRLAASVFSPDERAALASTSDDPDAVVSAFYAGWCRKEAYLKATGHGVSRGLDHFDVTLTLDDARLIADRLDGTAPASWRMHTLDLGLGYSAAVVVESGISEILLFEMP